MGDFFFWLKDKKNSAERGYKVDHLRPARRNEEQQKHYNMMWRNKKTTSTAHKIEMSVKKASFS